jgi:hypothetical protein
MRDWNAFADFMNSIYAAKSRLGLHTHQDVFFRGHFNRNYTLLPSLFRQPDTGEPDYYWRLERRTFLQFRTLARELYTSDRLDWDVLFHMQHHGVPTRLLDWTSVFGVALYFALLNRPDNSTDVPCIWLLNPYALNHAQWNTYNLFSPHYLARDEENNRSYDYGELLIGAHRGDQSQSKHRNWGRLPWNNPLAIYHDQRSDRMFAQTGWFTIHGTNTAPLEAIFPEKPEDPAQPEDSRPPKMLTKVEIPVEAIPAAQEFLTLAGIGHRQLFPGLDGLALSVKQRFGLNRPPADPIPKSKS